MIGDPLEHARALAARGRHKQALKAAWRAALPMVSEQDRDGLLSAAAFADTVAAQTTGSVNSEAVQLSRFCIACIDQPQESLLERWSLANLFTRRRPTKRCPDCAEDIAADARVCRFCGYRFEGPPASG